MPALRGRSSCFALRGGKGENPNSEFRNPKEIRNSNSEWESML
jgi:hypothetical protein